MRSLDFVALRGAFVTTGRGRSPGRSSSPSGLFVGTPVSNSRLAPARRGQKVLAGTGEAVAHRRAASTPPPISRRRHATKVIVEAEVEWRSTTRLAMRQLMRSTRSGRSAARCPTVHPACARGGEVIPTLENHPSEPRTALLIGLPTVRGPGGGADVGCMTAPAAHSSVNSFGGRSGKGLFVYHCAAAPGRHTHPGGSMCE